MMNRKAFKVLGVIIGIAGLMTLMLLLGIDIGRYENDEKNTQSQTVRKSADQEGSVIDYVNELREANGLPHLLEDVKLDASAKLKAEDMETKDYFEHTSPWGVMPWQWIDITGYQYSSVAENLAQGYKTNKETVDAWSNSPGHYRNMMNAEFTQVGSYTVKDEGRNVNITVNHYARPK